MTGEFKSQEFAFGMITYLLIIVSLILEPKMLPHDKILTIAMVNAVIWVVRFYVRYEKQIKSKLQ